MVVVQEVYFEQVQHQFVVFIVSAFFLLVRNSLMDVVSDIQRHLRLGQASLPWHHIYEQLPN